jgi:hypothetical protein
VVEPVEVDAVASDWAQQYCGQPDTVRKLVALARSEDKWLLYDHEKDEFSLAYGEVLPGSALSLLGFASDDALAEWLG